MPAPGLKSQDGVGISQCSIPSSWKALGGQLQSGSLCSTPLRPEELGEARVTTGWVPCKHADGEEAELLQMGTLGMGWKDTPVDTCCRNPGPGTAHTS